jgi:hypothetical protein
MFDLQMLPIYSDDSVAHGLDVNAIALCKGNHRRAGSIGSAGLYDLVSRQEGASIQVAFGLSSSSLCLLVAHIIQMCPKEQVIRTDAQRVIAMVQDVSAGWNAAVYQYPCDARCWEGLSIEAKSPVAICILRGCPDPAGLGLGDLVPEPLHTREV